MRMQKGLCVELNDKTSVFIGQNGEFVHGTPARETSVGEECYFYPKQEASSNRLKTIKPVWISFASAVAVALLFLSVLLPKQEAYAYVQVQVNPGIELGIDEKYEVVSIRELNEDGIDLIDELGEWENHSLDEILDKVIKLSVSSTTDEIIITTIPDEKDAIADETIVNAVMAISTKVLAGDVAVRLKDASRAQWRSSIEDNIPTGQLVTDSNNLMNDEREEPGIEEMDKKPQLIKEGQLNIAEPKEKEVKSTEALQDTDKKAPAAKEKVTPSGQEKRLETPAAEKGKANPPGQEKRNDVPGQNKKDSTAESEEPEDKEGKETAPGQQKKNEEINKSNGNGNVPPPKTDNQKHKSDPSPSKAAEKGKGTGKPSIGKDDSGNNGKQKESQSNKGEGSGKGHWNVKSNSGKGSDENSKMKVEKGNSDKE